MTETLQEFRKKWKWEQRKQRELKKRKENHNTRRKSGESWKARGKRSPRLEAFHTKGVIIGGVEGVCGSSTLWYRRGGGIVLMWKSKSSWKPKWSILWEVRKSLWIKTTLLLVTPSHEGTIRQNHRSSFSLQNHKHKTEKLTQGPKRTSVYIKDTSEWKTMARKACVLRRSGKINELHCPSK